MADIEVRTEEYRAEAEKLLGADRKIVLAMRKELRTASKPAGDRILGAIADKMPKRGGLAENIRSRGRVSILVDLRRGVRIQLANRGGMFMEQFEKGSIRHPVWGRWLRGQKPQSAPAGAGAAQFEAEADELQRKVVAVVTETARREL